MFTLGSIYYTLANVTLPVSLNMSTVHAIHTSHTVTSTKKDYITCPCPIIVEITSKPSGDGRDEANKWIQPFQYTREAIGLQTIQQGRQPTK